MTVHGVTPTTSPRVVSALDAVVQAIHAMIEADPQAIQATYATIRRWATERGLAPHNEPLDLGKINRKRIALGLAPFERVPESGVEA